MTLQTTVKTRAYTSRAGFETFDERLGEHRRLYNAALEHRRTAYRSAGKSVTKYTQSREFTAVRADDPDGFGAEDRRLAIGTLERLDRAYKAAFKRAKESGKKAGFPRFKNAARFRTLEIYSGANGYLRQYDPATGKGVIKIKGLPAIRFRDKRIPIDADGKPIQPKRILITRMGRLLHVCMSFAVGEIPPVNDGEPQNPVGIDAGVNKRATFSDGRTLARRRRGRKAKRLQRKMARQRTAAVKDGRAKWIPTGGGRARLEWSDKPSQGYRKTRDRYATELYRERTANRQELHREARAVVDRYDFIAVEKLTIQNMTRSAAGTLDNPGKGVSQKRGLNREILSQNWGEFADILESKAVSAGIPFVRVAPKFTSQTCGACGATDPESRNGESYDCRTCGYAADADVNAAENILKRGLTELGFNPDPESLGRRGALQNRLTPDRAKSASQKLLPGFSFL